MTTTPNAQGPNVPLNYPVLQKNADNQVTNIGSFSSAQLQAFFMAPPPRPKPTSKPDGNAARDAYDETGHMRQMRQLQARRALPLSPGVSGVNLQPERPINWEAIMGSVTGISLGTVRGGAIVSSRACDSCQNLNAHPKFAQCILMPNWIPSRCTNCHYNRTGTRFCSFEQLEKAGTSYLDGNGTSHTGPRP